MIELILLITAWLVVLAILHHFEPWPRVKTLLTFSLGFITFPMIVAITGLTVAWWPYMLGETEPLTPAQTYGSFWVITAAMAYLLVILALLRTNAHLGLGRICIRILTPLVNLAIRPLTWLLGHPRQPPESP